MPKWTDRPPTPLDGHAFRIVRTPAKGKATCVVTSTDILGCVTHFSNHRTIPCEGQDVCKACADGLSWRWHAYLSVIQLSTWEHVILELTAPPAETVRNYQAQHSGIRYCKLTVWRPSERYNGRVHAQCEPMDQRRIRIPEPPNVRKILCHIWGVQYVDPDVESLTHMAKRVFQAPPDNGDARYRHHQKKEPA